MNRIIPTIIVLVGTTIWADSAKPAVLASGAALNWEVIQSDGMRVDYPAEIFSVDAGPTTQKGLGRELRSSDGIAGFMYYVNSNNRGDTPSSFLAKSKVRAPIKLDYRRVTDRFVVISGVRNGRIYYGRCNFPAGANGPRHCIELVYPERDKSRWDPIVTRVSLSLR